MTDHIIDPVHRQWRKDYPRFPGVDACVELLNRSNTQGAKLDVICANLTDYGKNHPSELIDAFRGQSDQRTRLILLGVLEDMEAPETLPLFAEVLETEVEEERSYAMRGLRALDTKESRTILWNAENR